MKQVKFHVTSPSYFLPVFMIFSKHNLLSLLNDRDICFKESISTAFPKVHPEVCILVFIGMFVIIKNSTYTSSFFISMPVHKIIITFFFECRIERKVKCITGILIYLVKMFDIFLE